MLSNFQRSVLLLIAAIGATGIATGVAIAVSPSNFVKEDSGVTACKTISKNMVEKKSSDSKPMTEADYNRIREPFENSKYTDIKVAGTNIVDTVYQADTQPDPNNIGGAIILMGTLQGQWGQLQVACSKRGVDVPQLPTGS